jgi:hypothetical protein
MLRSMSGEGKRSVAAWPKPPRLSSTLHRTNARLGGQSDRHVSGVAGMLAGGAGRRGECWNHFALPAQRRIDLGGPWDDAA